MSSIFEKPDHIPPLPPSLPVFRIENPASTAKQWKLKVAALTDVFPMRGSRTEDTADRIVLRNRAELLQIHKRSDAFWYYHRDYANSENLALSERLPGAAATRQESNNWLKINGYWNEHIVFAGIGYTAVSPPGDFGENAVSLVKTEIKAHYHFRLDGLPVFGPGAKVQLGYTRHGISQALYFWRNARPIAGARRLMPADTALNRFFAKDPRFSKLRAGESKVRFRSLELGYYALPPFDRQEFLVPVFRVNGILETRAQRNADLSIQDAEEKDPWVYQFTHYVPALHNPDEAEMQQLLLPSFKGKVSVF